MKGNPIIQLLDRELIQEMHSVIPDDRQLMKEMHD